MFGLNDSIKPDDDTPVEVAPETDATVGMRGRDYTIAGTRYRENDNLCIVLLSSEAVVEFRATVNLHRMPDHQVYINRRLNAVITQRRANQWPYSEVRHIVIIHYIEMHDVGTRIQHLRDLLAKTRKICRQDGWCNLKFGHGQLSHDFITGAQITP